VGGDSVGVAVGEITVLELSVWIVWTTVGSGVHVAGSSAGLSLSAETDSDEAVWQAVRIMVIIGIIINDLFMAYSFNMNLEDLPISSYIL
jgi:hypothetical protein